MIKRIQKQLHLVGYTLKMIIRINYKILIIVIILSVTVDVFPVILLELTQNIINALQVMKSTLKEILQLVVVFIAFSCLSLIIQNLYSYYMNKLSIILSYNINYIIMDKCGSLPLSKLEETKTYDQLTRIENQISNKPYQSLQALIGILTNIITFLSAIGVLFYWKSWLCLIVLILSAINILYTLRIGNKQFSINYKRSDKERKSWYYSYLLTHDIAFKEIKVLNLSKYFINKYWRLSKAFIKQDIAINKLRIICDLIMSLFQDAFDAFVMILSIIESYEKLLLIGTAIANINVLSIIRSSVSSFSSNINLLYNGNLYMSLLEEFLSIETDSSEISSINIDLVKSIELCNLSFEYSSNNTILHNINFKITQGECIAVVGNNGSGKSTLLKIMCLLYAPNDGEILINGFNSSAINKTSYQKHISVLFQDYLKFEGKLLENIHIGDVTQPIDFAKMEKVLQFSNVDFLKNFHGYLFYKNLGNWFNNGTELSGGQWQKIALSRVYYKDADVFLLDEPSSALDTESESKIFDCFFKRCEGKIGIYITHRTKIAQKASKIVVLDHGNIVGIGSHKDLYQNCPFYRKLVDMEDKPI